MQYPEEIQDKLLELAEYVHIDQPGVTIFEQGSPSHGYFVIVRGTVKIEQKHLRYKDRPDMPPVVIRTAYDGDQIGEVSHFTRNVDKIREQAGFDNFKGHFLD